MNHSVTHVVILAAGQGTRMKSQLPKVLHPVAGRPMLEHVLDAAAAVAPATVTVVVGHAGAIGQAAPGGPAGPDVRRPGAAARNGARLAAGRAGAGRQDRHRDAALRRRAAADRSGRCERLLEAHRRRRRPQRSSRPWSNAHTATAASCAWTARSRASSRNATPRRPSARSARSTAASTPSTWRRCSTRCGASRRRTRRGSST